ncbi:DUF1272 domain-containing protein [Dasania marina]|uniref:DUF1272 domain-containing protein n=1 Tax=Dasania marina TaxID=471499 RepID=UPI003B837AC8
MDNQAVFCAFECTFCQNCLVNILNNIRPNCFGNLVQRLIQSAAELKNYPASTKRVLKKYA